MDCVHPNRRQFIENKCGYPSYLDLWLTMSRYRLFMDIYRHDGRHGQISLDTITETYLYNFDPYQPHFYIVKLGFTGVYIISFLFLLKNIDCGYSLEPPPRGGSNEHPQSMFWVEIYEISEFLSENFQFFVVKFLIYLNWLVFVILFFNSVRSTMQQNSAFPPSVSRECFAL